MVAAAGTGKTLVARALAASASRAGRRVAFFMRKGADILSKWVGEAERQLRLLFEEAQRQQPAIIFFDEIDGLAPVSCSVLPLCLPHLLNSDCHGSRHLRCAFQGNVSIPEGKTGLMLRCAAIVSMGSG